MLQKLRALWRLARLLFHLSAVLMEMALRFHRLPLAERHACIRRWSRRILGALGVRVTVEGAPYPGPCLIVANHVSWLDIMALHATCPQARFVSKADVLAWPALGWLIRSAGTLFIERERKRDALRVVHHMAEAMGQGDTVAIFPEGTTGAGPVVLPFHANLLQAAIAAEVPIQPAVLHYREPGQAFSWAAQYIDDTTLVASIWRVLCADQLTVTLTYLPAHASRHGDRRALAALLQGEIQQKLTVGRP